MSDTKSVVPAAGDKQTLVEEGTQFKGSLSSNCPVVVRGRIEGDVQAPSLTVSTSGAVHGKVKVDELRSKGEIAGEFDAEIVQLSGSVKDNTIIRAKSLEVKLSPTTGKLQVVFGECTLDVGEGAPKPTDTSRDLSKVGGAKGAKGKGAEVPAADARPAEQRQSGPPPASAPPGAPNDGRP
jgi:cytoskeletal protein CcmA (bactofilin family)